MAAYLMSCQGLTFFTKSGARLPLPGGAELVNAGRIWVPAVSQEGNIGGAGGGGRKTEEEKLF